MYIFYYLTRKYFFEGLTGIIAIIFLFIYEFSKPDAILFITCCAVGLWISALLYRYGHILKVSKLTHTVSMRNQKCTATSFKSNIKNDLYKLANKTRAKSVRITTHAIVILGFLAPYRHSKDVQGIKEIISSGYFVRRIEESENQQKRNFTISVKGVEYTIKAKVRRTMLLKEMACLMTLKDFKEYFNNPNNNKTFYDLKIPTALIRALNNISEN